MLVSGGETERLVSALPQGLRTLALRDRRSLMRLNESDLADIVTDRVRAAHDEFELDLIREVKERASGGGRAALGLSEVLAVLNEACVGHLVYDPYIVIKARSTRSPPCMPTAKPDRRAG